MKCIFIAVSVAISLCSCASNNAILELSEKEKAVISKVRAKVAENKPKVIKAADNLGELGADYEELNFELEDSLAKARQLESMQSFLSTVPEDFRETQRAVVLFHLYETEQAEQKVLQARMAQRRESTKIIVDAYSQFTTLLDDALSNLEILIRYVNQPKSAQILAVTDTFLEEVKSFRSTLQETDNSRLNQIAAKVQSFEERAAIARSKSAEALQQFLAIQGAL